MNLAIISRINAHEDEFNDAFPSGDIPFLSCPDKQVWIHQGTHLFSFMQENKEGEFKMNYPELVQHLKVWLDQIRLSLNETYILIHDDAFHDLRKAGLFWTNQFSSTEPDQYQKIKQIVLAASQGENCFDRKEEIIKELFHQPFIELCRERFRLLQNVEPFAPIDFERQVLGLPPYFSMEQLPLWVIEQVEALRSKS